MKVDLYSVESRSPPVRILIRRNKTPIFLRGFKRRINTDAVRYISLSELVRKVESHQAESQKSFRRLVVLSFSHSVMQDLQKEIEQLKARNRRVEAVSCQP